MKELQIWEDRKEKKSEYFKEQLREAYEFEKFIDEFFRCEGIELGMFEEKECQYKGENIKGIEIKYDKLFRKTGNLYIEFAEKQPNATEWIPSGIEKHGNSKFLLIGDFNKFWIFNINNLISLKHRFKNVTTFTSKGYLLPIEEAEKEELNIKAVIYDLK